MVYRVVTERGPPCLQLLSLTLVPPKALCPPHLPSLSLARLWLPLVPPSHLQMKS